MKPEGSLGGAPGGRALPRSSGVPARSLVRILGAYGERDSAARGELRGHNCFARRARFYEIVQNAVCDCFVKRSLVPVRGKIKFERFAFDAKAVRHVIDVDPGKIRLARDWTNRSEIIRFKMNPINAIRCRIWKSLEPRLSRRSRDFCFASPEQC